jgi:hypothetical protein
MQWAKTFCPDDEGFSHYKNNFHSLFGEESKTTIALFTCILLQPPRLRAFSHDLLNIQCFARQSINLFYNEIWKPLGPLRRTKTTIKILIIITQPKHSNMWYAENSQSFHNQSTIVGSLCEVKKYSTAI